MAVTKAAKKKIANMVLLSGASSRGRTQVCRACQPSDPKMSSSRWGARPEDGLYHKIKDTARHERRLLANKRYITYICLQINAYVGFDHEAWHVISWEMMDRSLGTFWMHHLLCPYAIKGTQHDFLDLSATVGHIMRRFSCDCGNVLFFGSTRCLACGIEVGFSPRRGNMERLDSQAGLKRCANGTRYDICNWTTDWESAGDLCISCRMNQVVPDLSRPQNRFLWARMESAKRRLIYTLLRLGIYIPTKKDDPQEGLAFEIASSLLDSSVTTGHLNGIITMNLEEADDTYRQINRQLLGEAKRTLLGHFRHESAHYLWARFLSNKEWEHPWRLAFREIFGNEWQDYGKALHSYYRSGPPTDWNLRFVSGYAASHPWEDWAETWSHYLQMLEGLETCDALGIQTAHLTLPLQMLPVEAGTLSVHLNTSPGDSGCFLAMLQRWVCFSNVLNEISDSLGEPAPCPLVISVAIVRKLHLAHYFARSWGSKLSETYVA